MPRLKTGASSGTDSILPPIYRSTSHARVRNPLFSNPSCRTKYSTMSGAPAPDGVSSLNGTSGTTPRFEPHGHHAGATALAGPPMETTMLTTLRAPSPGPIGSSGPSFPQLSTATEEILKRVSANASAHADAPSGWEAARQQVLKSMVTSDRLPTPDANVVKRGRGASRAAHQAGVGRGRGGVGVGGGIISMTVMATGPVDGVSVARGRPPGRKRGRGAGRGVGRGGKRKRGDSPSTGVSNIMRLML